MMTTTPTLTPSERDALYQSVVVALTGINDIYTAIENEKWDLADRLSCEFSDLLGLAQDLGWGKESRAARLTAPPDVLHRALSRLQQRADEVIREEAAEREELAAQGKRNQYVHDVCTRQLAALETAGGTRPPASK